MATKHLMAASMAAFVAGGGAAEADERETFICCEGFLGCQGSIPEITLTADHVTESGTIMARGLPEIETHFGLDGLDRRWDWTDDPASGNRDRVYAFIIEIGGDGAYYDFDGRERAKPSSRYKCESAW